MGQLGGIVLESQSRYETGKTVPSADYLARIAAHGVDVQFVLTGERNEGSPLAPDAAELLDDFLALPARLQQIALTVVKAMRDETGPPPAATVHESGEEYLTTDQG